MDNVTYERIGTKVDALFVQHSPLDSEANRVAYRNDLLQILEAEGFTEEDWMDELFHRLDENEKPAN